MSKILLVNPPLKKDELFKRGAKETGSLLPFLGLGYIAAVLLKEKHEVKIIDGVVEELSMQDIGEAAKNYDLIGIISVTSFALRSYETAKVIKEISKKKIVIGGPHVSAVPSEAIKKKYIDYVIVGECEYPMAELVRALEGKMGINLVKNLYYKENGVIKFNGKRPLIENLDELPFPAWNLFPLNKYKPSSARTIHNKKSFSIITSRGCPFQCTFCSKDVIGTKYRKHSPERIIDEINYLIKKYGAEEIAIWDEEFTIDKERVKKFCDLLKKENIKIDWSCSARVNSVDYELLHLMKQSGCSLIMYGVESGNQEMLKRIKKYITLGQIEKAFKITKRAGIPIRAFFMLGLVGDTIKTMKQTIAFAKKLNPDIASFTLLAPLPNTEDYTNAQKEGKFTPEYWDKIIFPEFNFLDKPIYLPEGITEKQLLSIHKKAYLSFYLRPKFIIKQVLAINSISEIKRLFRGTMSLVRS